MNKCKSCENRYMGGNAEFCPKCYDRIHGGSTMYTGGPWATQTGAGAYTVIESGPYHKVVAHVKSQRTGSEQLANANLVASAPDLLEACEAFVEAWEKSLQLEKTDVALRMAKIAIEKAKGKA